jgi:uncharacterized protein (TIGR02466 family)
MIYKYFSTPFLTEQKPEFITSLIKATDKYIKDARKKNKKLIKETNDFGVSHHSKSLLNDNKFLDFKNYISNKTWAFLENQGFDLTHYQTFYSEMWVQEFAKNGGGHHSTHVHRNQHVSGFYFLKSDEQTAYPIFHDPRPGALMTKLPEKNTCVVSDANDKINFKPIPGTVLIFPGYIPHEFTVDKGKSPFRFIHFNIQAVPKGIITE